MQGLRQKELELQQQKMDMKSDGGKLQRTHAGLDRYIEVLNEKYDHQKAKLTSVEKIMENIPKEVRMEAMRRTTDVLQTITLGFMRSGGALTIYCWSLESQLKGPENCVQQPQ